VRRGLTIVTQPGFLADRGDDYLRDVPEPEDLYRVGSLMSAGVGVRLSSDAPYGPLDPWRVIEAAVQRRTPQGQIAGPGERITQGQALQAYLGPPVRPGAPADLVLLDGTGTVRCVYIGGRRVADQAVYPPPSRPTRRPPVTATTARYATQAHRATAIPVRS
jgi:hypothetical protein